MGIRILGLLLGWPNKELRAAIREFFVGLARAIYQICCCLCISWRRRRQRNVAAVGSDDQHPDERLTAFVTATSASAPTTSTAPKKRVDAGIPFVDVGPAEGIEDDQNAGAEIEEDLMVHHKSHKSEHLMVGMQGKSILATQHLRAFRSGVTHQFFEVCLCLHTVL